MSTEVRNNTALERFEIYVDGAIAGYAEYQDTASERAFVHAEISPRHEGQGYGRALVEAALDDSRREGYGILPLCPMVKHFVETNGEYVAAVPQWARERLGLPQ
ncbi:GNAT family N-acetyltransferase [Nocardia arizonensis]|uniref:GNAT family N-acetyltransferase n=1 Tax=Nocardia arizonensis TaxID=1141647 RepID=UPI0006D1BDE9|nr:GNAT family N-acetyltransferase [Nocardia arizonensis]